MAEADQQNITVLIKQILETMVLFAKLSFMHATNFRSIQPGDCYESYEYAI